MILARLTGGFGNQLFQYAFAKATARRLGVELVLDASLLGESEENDQVVLRYYDLDLIKVKDRLATQKEVKKFNNIASSGIMDKLKLKANLRLGKVNWFIQQGHQLDIQLAKAVKDETAIVGRFQSEKFFEEAKDMIKEELDPDAIAVNDLTKSLYEQYKTKERILIHVRRGDYVSHPIFSKTIGALDPEYYSRALVEVMKKVEDPGNVVVLVVSDDIEWCKANLSDLNPVFVEQERSKLGFASDFWLLTKANYSIISNSTFSWWGAWLAEARGHAKLVIAPSKWSKAMEATPDDVLPERWLKIDNQLEGEA